MAARAAGVESAVRRARDTLALANQRLITKVAGKYINAVNGDVDDLMQAGMIGLMRSIETFNPEKGSFSTYAILWIRHEIQNHVDKAAPEHKRAHQMPQRIALAIEKHRARTGETPSAESLGVTEQELIDWAQRTFFISLSEPDREGSHNSAGPVGHAVSRSLEDHISTDDTNVEERMQLLDAIGQLRPRERRIVHALFFDDKSCEEVGEIEGLSTARIRQLRNDALEDLKVILE